MRPEWKDFVGGKWENEVNVRDFIQRNYHPYDGDESFLAEATQNTKDLWHLGWPFWGGGWYFVVFIFILI